jgi:hypothetical protein
VTQPELIIASMKGDRFILIKGDPLVKILIDEYGFKREGQYGIGQEMYVALEINYEHPKVRQILGLPERKDVCVT